MANIKWVGSPNFDTNRKPIDRIIIHWMVGTLASTDAQFQKPAGTSAHYGIEDENIHQYVKEEHVAYHAGVYAMNQRSIGIEHSATPTRPASEATYRTSAALVAQICKKYNIPLDRQHILKHSEVKATQCCGTVDIDKIINLAKNIPMGSITIDTNLYEKLVGNSSAKKDVATYLEIANPDDTSADEMKRVIGGFKSRATDLQNQLNTKDIELKKALTEVKNQQDKVANVMADCQKTLDLKNAELNTLKEVVKTFDKERGLLNASIVSLQGEVREAQRQGGIKDLAIADLQVKLEQAIKGNQPKELTIKQLIGLILSTKIKI